MKLYSKYSVQSAKNCFVDNMKLSLFFIVKHFIINCGKVRFNNNFKLKKKKKLLNKKKENDKKKISKLY